MAPRRAVFLDRDGVLIEEVDYLSRVSDLRLLPGSAAAVRRLRQAGWLVIVVSNQSGIARGYFTLATLKRIHAKLAGQLRARGAKLDALYFCPHHPKPQGRCECRKPKIGMLLAAARRFKIDLKASYLVGDASSDISAARRAGCTGVLVRTGHGGKDGKYRAKPAVTLKDLAAAADWILSRETQSA